MRKFDSQRATYLLASHTVFARGSLLATFTFAAFGAKDADTAGRAGDASNTRAAANASRALGA